MKHTYTQEKRHFTDNEDEQGYIVRHKTVDTVKVYKRGKTMIVHHDVAGYDGKTASFKFKNRKQVNVLINKLMEVRDSFPYKLKTTNIGIHEQAKL